MGTYSRVVSVVKPITAIRTFVGGVAKDITSGWTFVNGVRKQVFPTTEQYTQVYSKTSNGSYSTTLGFGKYKLVLSGAGGAGGAATGHNITDAMGQSKVVGQNGFAGEKKEIIITVAENETKTITGVIGQGGGRAYSVSDRDLSDMTAIAGAGGTGYASGTAGTATYGTTTGYSGTSTSSVAAGGGGGSSRLLVDGVSTLISKGGNGGKAEAPSSKNSFSSFTLRTATGGTGGSGGVTNGTGASGGAGKKFVQVTGRAAAYSNDGSDGYVYIYKSNIYPA